jgi:hypothetical protein
MRANDSHHLLPMNSMLFTSYANLRSPLHVGNPTLVDMREAADMNVTALPAPSPTKERKPSAWRRMLAKIKGVFGGKNDEEVKVKEDLGKVEELVIGGPTDFEHRETWGVKGLRDEEGELGEEDG